MDKCIMKKALIQNIVFDEFDLPKELETKQITKFNLITKKQNVSINLSKTPISIVLRKKYFLANELLRREIENIHIKDNERE